MVKSPKVKCKYCGRDISKDGAFVVHGNKRNKYYCSEEHSKMINPRDKFYTTCMQLVKSTSSVVYKEFDAMANVHGFKKMSAYLDENIEYLEKAMSKDFDTRYGAIKYLAAILNNSLDKYEYPSSTPQIKIESEHFDITKIAYKRKKKRSGLDDLF